MSLAWETTTDDIRVALSGMLGRGIRDMTDAQIEYLSTKLDHEEIEKAALYGDNIEQQTEYAIEEIREQIRDIGCAY